MCASRRRTKWISGNVQNNCRNMTDYVSASDSTCTQYCRPSALYKLLCMYVCKSSGREFHAVGPATAKARRPKVRRWRGTERRWRLAERRRCRQKYVFQKYVADAWPHFIWEIGHTGYHIGHALFLNFVVRHTCDTVDIISTCQTRSQPSGNGGRFPQILDF